MKKQNRKRVREGESLTERKGSPAKGREESRGGVLCGGGVGGGDVRWRGWRW
ncbi:hypothetical protein A2U01_0104318 [Trifolium medium]|uniref:Uncharacterized protein n=1 Tax=Trifolium medium TaxID=97028 RepID=A0A392V6K4_9FABA|nr:hypothetical protein [Trifolium medium]